MWWPIQRKHSPCSCAHPESLGCMQDYWRKLSVRTACRIIWHQRWSGKSLWVLESYAMKCSLKVLIARSAEFLRWMWGRTSWNCSFTSVINFLEHLDTHCPVYEGVVSALCWSRGCGVFGTLLWDPSLVLSWGVQRGLCLIQSGKRQVYTY